MTLCERAAVSNHQGITNLHGVGGPAAKYPVTGKWWGDPDADPVPDPQPNAQGKVRRQAFSVTLTWPDAWELTRNVLLADSRAVENGETVEDSDESNWLTYGVTYLSQFAGAVSLGCGLLLDIGTRLRAAIDSDQPVLVPDWLAERGAGVPPEGMPGVVVDFLAQRLISEQEDDPKIASRAYGMLILRAVLQGDAKEFGELVNAQTEPEWLVPGVQDACIAVAVMAAGVAWGEEQKPSAVVAETSYVFPGEKLAELLRTVKVEK